MNFGTDYCDKCSGQKARDGGYTLGYLPPIFSGNAYGLLVHDCGARYIAEFRPKVGKSFGSEQMDKTPWRWKRVFFWQPAYWFGKRV